MIFWAYWFTFASSCFSWAYSCWASTNPRQISIASSSFAPIRRINISFRPALASKIHFPLRCTIGIANGNSSFPTERMVRLEFFGSTLNDVFSFALAAKSVARFLSATGSAELIRLAASGPRISFKVATSNTSAARIRVSAASFAELNSCCFFESEFAAVSDFFSEAACTGNPRNPKATIVKAITDILEEVLKAELMFIVLSIETVFIVGVRHRHHEHLFLHLCPQSYCFLDCCWHAWSYR